MILSMTISVFMRGTHPLPQPPPHCSRPLLQRPRPPRPPLPLPIEVAKADVSPEGTVGVVILESNNVACLSLPKT